MGDKLKILLLSPYLPSIDTAACARKIYDYVRLLHQRGHRIYLLSFCSEKDRKRINTIGPYCTESHLEYIPDYNHYPSRSASLTEKIILLCKKGIVNILQCENAYMSRYLPTDINIASVLTEHEVLSASFYERAGIEDNPVKKTILYARALKKLLQQKNWYTKFSKIIVFTQEDKDIIHKLYNIEHIEVVPLGINLRDYPLQKSEERPYDIVFTGNFTHSPNVDAALYFYKEILPLIKNKFSNILVVLAGANPPFAVKKLGQSDNNMLVTEYVENIREYYYRSKVFIVPVRYGTGMRFKILEALASGIPVVSTATGARGLICENTIKIAGAEKDFAATVIELLNNENLRKDLARRGRLSVEKYYHWEMLLNRYENIYYNLLR